MPDEPVESLLVGHWVTSFDVAFPNGDSFIPTAILACFHFEDDGTFTLDQRRNKGGALDVKSRTGDYSISVHPSGVIEGEITIAGTMTISLRFFLEDRDELHWIMESAVGPTPVAQGTMHKIKIVRP